MIYRAFHGNDEFEGLTDQEYKEAWDVGEDTFRSSQSRGFKDHWSYHRSGLDGLYAQAIGSVGERAVAKILRVPWFPKMDTFKDPDLDFNIESRVMGCDWYGLRVRQNDLDSRRVVAVIIQRGKEREPYRFPGWINAVHGKREEYKIDPRSQGLPMFSVPQERLHSLDKLRALIGGGRGVPPFLEKAKGVPSKNVGNLIF